MHLRGRDLLLRQYNSLMHCILCVLFPFAKRCEALPNLRPSISRLQQHTRLTSPRSLNAAAPAAGCMRHGVRLSYDESYRDPAVPAFTPRSLAIENHTRGFILFGPLVRRQRKRLAPCSLVYSHSLSEYPGLPRTTMKLHELYEITLISSRDMHI